MLYILQGHQKSVPIDFHVGNLCQDNNIILYKGCNIFWNLIPRGEVGLSEMSTGYTLSPSTT